MSNKTIYPPLVLTSKLTGDVDANNNGIGPGIRIQFDPAKLKNPYRTGTWVYEFRFFIAGLGTTGGPVFGPGDFWLKLAVGRNPITPEFVPAWLMGKTICNFQDIAQQPLIAQGNISGGLYGALPTFVWRLAKPMWLPAGESVTAYLWHNGQDATTTDSNKFPSTYFSVFGRCAEDSEQPRTVCMPFMSAFIGQRNLGGGTYIDQSYERDLMNPFGTDFFIERFVGRVGVANNIVSGVPTSGLWDSNGNSIGGQPTDQAGATNTLMRGVSSIGGQMVKDATPFDALFYGPERSWPVHTWIPPKTFFKFYLQENYASLSASNYYRPEISLVGYREVALNA